MDWGFLPSWWSECHWHLPLPDLGWHFWLMTSLGPGIQQTGKLWLPGHDALSWVLRSEMPAFSFQPLESYVYFHKGFFLACDLAEQRRHATPRVGLTLVMPEALLAISTPKNSLLTAGWVTTGPNFLYLGCKAYNSTTFFISLFLDQRACLLACGFSWSFFSSHFLLTPFPSFFLFS